MKPFAEALYSTFVRVRRISQILVMLELIFNLFRISVANHQSNFTVSIVRLPLATKAKNHFANKYASEIRRILNKICQANVVVRCFRFKKYFIIDTVKWRKGI